LPVRSYSHEGVERVEVAKVRGLTKVKTQENRSETPFTTEWEKGG